MDGARESVAVHRLPVGLDRGDARIRPDNGPALLNQFKDGVPSARPTPGRFTGAGDGTRQEVPHASLMFQPGISVHVFLRSIPVGDILVENRVRSCLERCSDDLPGLNRDSPSRVFPPFPHSPGEAPSAFRVVTLVRCNRRASTQPDGSPRDTALQFTNSKYVTGSDPAGRFVSLRRPRARAADFRHPQVSKNSNSGLPCRERVKPDGLMRKLMTVRCVTAAGAPRLDNSTGFNLSCGVRK